MTLGQLKEFLAKSELPDDAQIFVELTAKPGKPWFREVYEASTVEDTGNLWSRPSLMFNICYHKG